ncbi:hypothetical protein DWB61_09720 [Ancylomarina euxinus]|uniref:Thiopeptide-type bacteriocin biosynthesis domain-containing protein n=1 Tax=Ancylomarina euxinus TaxID=2283627 RepID=A0A425Y137_9BACT|nr:thiopeptide-type bacteriocin biosynthesis protein [Ancylomarina euxinus]MCZ4693794.1 thiopeptide-type bacteriocin biosynthesis protein [Ancylomarina euxinus]MUP15126.1 hypothetical protein [Ancylomarina euxinus]RRG21549.1 hypothetical protein DWB61_09720 [Ancylomarina euxinus]
MNSTGGRVKRKFIVGDEWLYFKFYCGPKIAEVILIEKIKPIVDYLIDKAIIDQFFFIRFADPDYHIRIRFHIIKLQDLNLVLKLINTELKKFVNDKIISTITYDTYNREIERYGESTICLIEKIFFYDSVAVIKYLSSENDDNKWKWGIKMMDSLLDEWGIDIYGKQHLFQILADAYFEEVNGDKNLRLQIDQKFRKEKQEIRKFICRERFEESIENRFILDIGSLIKELRNEIDNSDADLFSILSSIIHMHFNRLFRTKQRLHEMIIYYFMNKYYKSEIARLKYSNTNAINV